MDKLVKWLENLIRVQKNSRAWRTFVSCLAAIVVFTTTYSLILPAITVEQSATEDVGGLVLDEADPGSTGAEAEAMGEVVSVDAENETSNETVQNDVTGADEEADQTTPTGEAPSESKATQSVASRTETVKASESTAAVTEEGKEPVNGEVQTIGDKRVMTLTGEDFDVVVSGDLSVGVSDGTVLSVRGIPDAEVVKSFSDRISDELLKIFVDTKTTEVLYQLVFTDENLFEYAPTGYFDVQFIFHQNTVTHTGEMIYAAIYDYLTDEMILAEKNGDEYETPVIALDEYGIIKGITLKGMHFDEYSDIITLVAGPVNEELKLAAEKAAPGTATESKAENGTKQAKSKPSQKSTENRTNSSEVKTISAQGSDYTVELSYGTDAKIPDDAKLKVKEIESGTWLYKQYLKQARAAMKLDSDEKLNAEQARFFDITITSGSKEVEPAADVNVSIQYNKPVVRTISSESADVSANVIHFTEDEANLIEVSADNAQSVEFATESFSVYGIIYTVDFETKDGGTFSMPGETEMFLSELIEELKLPFDISKVKKVAFTDEQLLSIKKVDEGYKISREVEAVGVEDVLIAEQKSSNDINAEIVFVPSATETVEAKNNDWLMTSLQPFSTNETLTIILSDNIEYEISVTDAYETITQSPIALQDYATLTATIDGTTVINDAERDASFEIKIGYSFDEDAWRLIKDYITENHACPEIEYDFSSALADSAFKDVITGGTSNLVTATGKRIGKMTVDSSGKATIQLTNLQYLLGQSKARGTIEFVVETDATKLGDEDSTTIQFPGTTTPLIVNYKDKITVKNKTINKVENTDGSYTLNYTAGLTTTDDLTTLTFVDTMTGEQTLDTSSVKVNGQPVSVTPNNNGFTLDMVSQAGTGGTLSAGTYTVTYSTTVSKATLDALAEGGSTTGTNSANWTADGGREYPGGGTEYKIDKPVKPVPIEKTVDKSSASAGDTVTYTVTYGDGETQLAGFRIIDKITDVYTNYSAINVSYNGTSTTLTASDTARDSNYSTNQVTLFDYTFPNDLTGNGPVTVTYTAQLIDNATAKANNIYGTVNAANTAQEGKSWKEDGTTTIVEYPPEPSYSVSKSAVAGDTDEDGNWLPGSTVTYTIVINADQSADMSNVVLSDVMTDLQKLNGNITISYGGTIDTIPAEAGATDDNYSTGNTTLFNYTMPGNAGNVAVTIVYTTTIADAETAASIGIFGNTALSNTAKVGTNSDGTNGTIPYEDIPFEKEATYDDSDTDSNGNLTPGSVIHYKVIYGSDKASNDGLTILDQINDIQKLTGNVSITLPKLDQDVTWPDGTVWSASTSQKTYTMPIGSSGYAEDGVVWDYFSDGSYNPEQWARVFNLKLPNGIGSGEITVEYDVEVISEDEARANGIIGLKNAQNKVNIAGKEKSTSVPVQFEEEAKREPTIVKEFADVDLKKDIVYWNIYIDKTEDSAFPLYDITIGEGDGYGNKPYSFVSSTNTNIAIETSMIDWVGATITTESGIVLQAGVDYTLDKINGTFHFEQLDGPITIFLPINSPQDIINTYLMHNVAYVKYPSDKYGNYGYKNDPADYTYQSGEIDATKTGVYDEANRRIKWTVLLNPTRDKVDPDSINVWFSDAIPEGLTLLNYDTYSEENPTISVFVNGDGDKGGPAKNLYYTYLYPVTVNSDNEIEQIDIAPHANPYSGNPHDYGLSYVSYTITYYTHISDSEWANLTSSLTGSETFTNDVTFRTSGGKTYDAEDEVTVEYNRYVIKTDETNETSNHVIIDEEGTPSNVLSYRIQINPDKAIVNNNNALTLTDYIATNMDLDTDTVKLETAEGHELTYDELEDLGITISYDDDTRYLTITGIPDKTAYILTYDALAKGKGTDTYTNTAVLIGGGSHSSKTEKEHTVEMVAGSFVAEGVSLGLKKVDQYKITKSLEGAEFELYKYNLKLATKYTYQSGRVSSAADHCDNPWLTTTSYAGVTYYIYDYSKIEAVINGTYSGTDVNLNMLKEDFDIEGISGPINEQTTDAHGELTFGGLAEWDLYYWVETKAPDDYVVYSSEPHNFVLFSQTDGEDSYPTEIAELHYNIAKAIDHAASEANDFIVATYANEGTWVVTNVEDKYTYVSVKKVWEGDSDDLYETRPKEGIQVNLYQIDADGNETLMSDMSPVSLNVSASGNWDTYTWNKLPATYTDDEGVEHRYKYTVKEVKLSDYTTAYSDNGEGVVFGIVTVTNKLIPKYTSIYVKKEFNGDITNYPGQILVELYVIKTDSEGVSSEPEPSGYTGALTADSGWSFSWDKLPTKDEDGNKLTYTVKENLTDLQSKGFNYSVVYSDNNEGVMSSTEEEPLVIINTPRGSVQVTKVFSGLSAPTVQIPEDFQISNDYNDSIFTINNSTSGSGTASDPYVWIIEDVAVGTEVTFTESGVTVDGYHVTITANGTVQAEGSVTATASAISAEIADGVEVPTASFVNTYVKSVLEVTKIWKSSEDQNVEWVKNLTLKLHKGSETVYEYTVSKNEREGTYSAVSSDQGAPDATVSGDPQNGYKIVFSDLDDARNYYVTEDPKVDGYQAPIYARLIGGSVSPKAVDEETAGKALDGEYIINRPEDAVTLPSTGGFGTTLFYTIGLLLIALAAGLYTYLNRKNLTAICLDCCGNSSGLGKNRRRGGGDSQ